MTSEQTINFITEYVCKCYYGVLHNDGSVGKVNESYRSLTPDQFENTNYGVCHDYANWVTFKLAKELGYKPGSKLDRGVCAIMYIHHKFEYLRVHDVFHALPVFMDEDGKVHEIEGSWKDERVLGHNVFNSLNELFEYQIEKFINLALSKLGGSKHLSSDYWTTTPKWEGGLTREQLLARH